MKGPNDSKKNIKKQFIVKSKVNLRNTDENFTCGNISSSNMIPIGNNKEGMKKITYTSN